ncbi:MAG: threonine/serine exporter family protein [Clostridiales bacterium]|nr:threonine/serine exporter family protein [Clostridiales bacterium]
MIKEVLCCIFGTLAFAVTMKAPKRSLIFIIIGSAITSGTERLLCQYYGDFIACFSAMVCLVFYCELLARTIKMPSTVLLMPSTIPLLPGSSIYYAMFYAISGSLQECLGYCKATIYAGLGIALGAVVGTTVIRLINSYR